MICPECSFLDRRSYRDVDLVILYSDEPNKATKSPDIFSESRNTSAYIAESARINPTKYIVDIKNATRPYILSIAESFDPRWSAHINSKNVDLENSQKVKSLPLFSIINGFYINATGDYTVIIENDNQQLLHVGGTVSILTITILTSTFIVGFYVKRKRSSSD